MFCKSTSESSCMCAMKYRCKRAEVCCDEWWFTRLHSLSYTSPTYTIVRRNGVRIPQGLCCLARVDVLLHFELVSSHVHNVFICHIIWEREICFLWLRQCFLTLVSCSTCVILDCWNVIWVTFSCAWRIVFVCTAHLLIYFICRPTDLLCVRIEGAGCPCPWVLQSSMYVRQTSVRRSKRSVTSPTQTVAVEAIGFLRFSPWLRMRSRVMCVGPDWKGVTRVFREQLGIVIVHSLDGLTCSRYARTTRPDGCVTFGHLVVMCVNLHSSLKDWKWNTHSETQHATMSTRVLKVLS
jgi:hypothetical protein